MMVGPQTDTELFQLCMGLWKRIRIRLSVVSLPSQEWEDIRSEAILRVFQKRTRLDPSRPISPWAFTVMWRCAQNALRRFLPRAKTKHYKWRADFQHPRPIETKVVHVDDWGNECMRVEPDIVDTREETITMEQIEKFSATLDPGRQRLLDLAIKSPTVQQVAREMKWKYARAQRGLLDLQRAYQRYQLAA